MPGCSKTVAPAVQVAGTVRVPAAKTRWFLRFPSRERFGPSGAGTARAPGRSGCWAVRVLGWIRCEGGSGSRRWGGPRSRRPTGPGPDGGSVRVLGGSGIVRLPIENGDGPRRGGAHRF